MCVLYLRKCGLSSGKTRNRESATFALPTGYDGLNVVVSEGVGHIEPVNAVVCAGIAVGSPRQSAAIVLDGVEKAGELAGRVSRFLHGIILPHFEPIARVRTDLFALLSGCLPRV